MAFVHRFHRIWLCVPQISTPRHRDAKGVVEHRHQRSTLNSGDGKVLLLRTEIDDTYVKTGQAWIWNNACYRCDDYLKHSKQYCLSISNAGQKAVNSFLQSCVLVSPGMSFHLIKFDCSQTKCIHADVQTQRLASNETETDRCMGRGRQKLQKITEGRGEMASNFQTFIFVFLAWKQLCCDSNFIEIGFLRSN